MSTTEEKYANAREYMLARLVWVAEHHAICIGIGHVLSRRLMRGKTWFLVLGM
jgi:hypothetical protein